MGERGPTTRVGLRPTVFGISEFERDMIKTSQLVRNNMMTLKDLSATRNEAIAQVWAQRRIKMLTRTEYRMEHAAMFETMRAMGDLVRIGTTLNSMFQTYTMMMYRVGQQETRMADTKADLATIEEARARILTEFSADSYYAIQANKDYEAATERLGREQEQLTHIQQQNRMGLIGLGLQAMQVPRQLWYLQYHLRMTRDYMLQAGGVSKVLSSNFASLGAAAKVLGGILLPLLAGQAVLMGLAPSFAQQWNKLWPDIPPDQREIIKNELAARGIYLREGPEITINQTNNVFGPSDYEQFLDLLMSRLDEVYREEGPGE